MKALSLWQPWAAALVFGVKRNETRSWSTKHRGMLAIHAAKRRHRDDRACFEDILSDSPESKAAFGDRLALDYDTLTFGAVVGFGRIADCVATHGLAVSELEERWGNYENGRFSWRFDRVWRLREPVFCVGRQGFFDVALRDEEVAAAQLVEAFEL